MYLFYLTIIGVMNQNCEKAHQGQTAELSYIITFPVKGGGAFVENTF